MHPCVGLRGAGEKFSRQPVRGLERAGDREVQDRRELCTLDCYRGKKWEKAQRDSSPWPSDLYTDGQDKLTKLRTGKT